MSPSQWMSARLLELSRSRRAPLTTLNRARVGADDDGPPPALIHLRRLTWMRRMMAEEERLSRRPTFGDVGDGDAWVGCRRSPPRSPRARGLGRRGVGL